MAESYRGLTIQIGGDTTKLTKALHTANQAVSGTQSALKKLSDALKLDPSSFEAAQLQVGAFASQAANTAARLATLNDAIHQVGEEVKSFDGGAQSIKAMADSWDNVNMKASQTRDYFSELTKTIATAYTELSKKSAEAAKNVSDIFKSTDFGITTNVNEVIDLISSLPDDFQKSSSEIKSFRAEAEKMQESYVGLAERLKMYQEAWYSARSKEKKADLSKKIVEAQQEMDALAEKYDALVAKFTTLSGTTYKFDNNNVDIESLKKAIAGIEALGVSTDGMLDKFKAMKTEFETAFENVKTANAVEGYKDLEAEATKAAAKVKSLVDEMVRLSNTSDVAKGLVSLEEEFKEITASGATAKERLEGILAIMQKDGNQNSTFLQREAMREYAEATAKADAAVKNISERLDHYDGTIRKLAGSTKSYSAETTAAYKNYEEAAAALKNYEGVMESLRIVQDKIKAANPKDFADDEDYKNIQQTLLSMDEVLTQLKTRFADAKAEKKKFVEIAEVRELTDSLAVAKDTADSLSKINIKVETDVSALDGLKQALEAISKGIFESKGFGENGAWDFSKTAEDIMVAGKALDDARARYKALSSAVKDNPLDMGLSDAQGEAREQYIEKLRSAIAAYNAEVDAIPVDKIDQTALAAGNVSEAFTRAKLRVDELDETISHTEARLAELREQRSGIKVVDDESQQAVNVLDERIEAMKTTLGELQVEADQALDNFVTEDNTRRVDNARTKAQELSAEIHKVIVEGEKAGGLDITPKYDDDVAKRMESAFKQLEQVAASSVGMDKKIVEIKNFDKAVEEAVKRAKTFDEALKAEPSNKLFQTARADAMAEAVHLATVEQEKLNVAIQMMKSTEIDKTALSMGTVAKKLEEARSKFTDAVTNLRAYESALKKVSDQLAKLEKKSESERTEEEKQKIIELTAEYKRLQEAKDKVIKQGDEAFNNVVIEQNTQSIVEMGDKYNRLIQIIAELKKTAMETHQQDGTPKIDEAAFVQVLDRIAQAARQVGQEIIQSANEIDAAYRNVTKTVNGTEEQLQALKDAAIEFSQSNVTSADKMLEMQALGGQLGVLVEDLEQFGRIGANLDIATDMDAEDIALKLGQISNVLQLDIDGMQGFADALVRLGNNMPAQESSIMAVAQRFGAVAATANFSGDEILAWSAAIAATGQRSEAAATAISNTVSGIEQAVANGGSDLKQFAAIASMSADEFVESWKTSPTATLKAFIEGLKTLKDSDESAVAALENMGITGVRQQQTLLNLTQTIDNLGNALAMSNNAWNGITDQWGQSGDAAVEAQKKSEGFSGALAILQNNAQNLMASMGDSLVPLLKNVSDILEFVTDVFNNLPAPIKTLVVELGAASIAFSTLVPIMNVFSKGMTSVIKAVGEAHSIGEFIAKITGFSKAAEAATAATGGLEAAAGGLGAAFSGPVVLGIAAAVAALMVVIAKINEYNEHQQKVIDATDGLTRAMSDGKASYDTYVAGAQESSRSVLELKDAINEATEAQANYAEEVRSAWDGISASEAEVDILVQKIEELANKGSLTTEEQNELNAAVKSFNNVCGENVHVLDAQSGMLDTSIDNIKGMADAWESSLENDQLIKQYASNVEQIAEKQKLLDEVNQKLKSANPNQWFTDMRDGAGVTAASYADLTRQAETLESEIAALKEQQRQTVADMDDANEALGMIEAGLREQGQSLSDYGQFTDEELEQITELYEKWSFNSSLAIQKVIDLLNELKGGDGAASEIAKQLEETSKAADKARAEAYKAEATDDYNARKAELDKIYNDTKRSYDAQYNELKQSLDAEYNEKKRQLDRQYDLRKRALDKEYDAQKQAYDKQYDVLKRSLDRQYDAQKLKLDHELDAIKKSNDAKLQALKRRFDNEEDAYKDATEHQVKELERRHKLEIRAIEDERDARVNAIDEQIRALEALSDAEQHEVDKTKQDNKIAELQKEVDSAKSRRKKAEAEKKLNEYLQEVEVKRRKWERDLQIEDLKLQKEAIKEEADARKDAANDKYDIEKEAFKNARDAELELMKQANDDRYNAMKLALEAEEQAKKEANDLALENIKYNHQNQLQELKDHNDAQLAALKEKNELELQSIKDNNDMILQSMKDAHSAQLDNLKNSQSIELENRKAAQTKELQDLKAFQNARYKQIKAGQDEEGQAERAKNQQILNEEAEAQKARSEAQARHLYSMEQRMQEMGDKNIKTSSEANETINRNTENELSNLSNTYRDRFQESMDAISRVFGDNSGMVATEAQNIADSAQAPFTSMTASQYTSGWHFISNFVSGVQEAWGRGGWGGVFEYLASQVQSLWGHSVPKRGPLSDDDKWGGHFVENIVDGMRSKEKELYRQVEKMADAVEEGFDPTLSVDAAFEALDTIGKNRGKSLEVLADSKSAPVVNVTLNMNLSGVSIREDADIERLAKAMSQEMAAQAARQIAGRLG